MLSFYGIWWISFLVCVATLSKSIMLFDEEFSHHSPSNNNPLVLIYFYLLILISEDCMTQV